MAEAALPRAQLQEPGGAGVRYVCAKHKDVSKAKIKRYREARRAAKG
jgi:hypothetical protein